MNPNVSDTSLFGGKNEDPQSARIQQLETALRRIRAQANYGLSYGPQAGVIACGSILDTIGGAGLPEDAPPVKRTVFEEVDDEPIR